MKFGFVIFLSIFFLKISKVFQNPSPLKLEMQPTTSVKFNKDYIEIKMLPVPEKYKEKIKEFARPIEFSIFQDIRSLYVKFESLNFLFDK